MAWIKERRNGFLVCWREAETGKELSEFVRFEPVGSLSEFDAGEPLTEEQVREGARRAAESLAARMGAKERRSMTALNRVLAAAMRRGEKLPVDPLGMCRGEEGASKSTALRAEERHGLGSHFVENNADVIRQDL